MQRQSVSYPLPPFLLRLNNRAGGEKRDSAPNNRQTAFSYYCLGFVGIDFAKRFCTGNGGLKAKTQQGYGTATSFLKQRGTQPGAPLHCLQLCSFASLIY